MKVQITILIAVVFLAFSGCQPYNDASLNQRISELKDEIEKSKNVTPALSNDTDKDVEALIKTMTKAYEESVKALIEKMQTTSPLIETKFDELNKEVIRLSMMVSKLELEKDKRIGLEDEVEKFREKLAEIEKDQFKVENDMLKKHFETQNAILEKMSTMVENLSNTAPAEVTKQLQAQFEELSKKVETMEVENTKLQEDLKAAQEDLEKKDKRIDALKNDKEMLEAALEKAKKGRPDDEVKKDDDTGTGVNSPNMILGKVYEVKLASPNSYTAMVKFPLGTKLTKGFLMQVFNDKGEKIGRFKVSVPSVEPQPSDGVLVGGEITTNKNVLDVKKGFRVSTMMNMPDITKAGN